MQTNAIVNFPMDRASIRRRAVADHRAGVPVAACPYEGTDRLTYEHARTELQRSEDFEHAECA